MIINCNNKIRPFLSELIFFFLSFIFAGTISVIPQAYLLKYYPLQKNAYLVILIFFGTVASMLGVRMSNAPCVYRNMDKRKYAPAIMIIAVAVLMNALFYIGNILAFIAALAAAKYISNLIYNYLDTLISIENSENYIKKHVNIMLVYQLSAYIIAPLYLSAFYFHSRINGILLAVLSILSILFMTQSEAQSRKENVAPITNGQTQKLDSSEIRYILYAILIQTGISIVSSLIIFILKDYYNYKDALLKGGMLISYIGIIAIAVIYATSYVNAKRGISGNPQGVTMQIAPNYIAIACFFISAWLLYMRGSQSFIYMLIIGTFTGTAYGLFLYSTRTYANMKAKLENKGKMLVYYNNIPNIGILASLGLIALFTILSNKYGMNIDKAIILTLMFLCCISVFVVMNYSHHSSNAKGHK
jgi:hypothetical protein